MQSGLAYFKKAPLKIKIKLSLCALAAITILVASSFTIGKILKLRRVAPPAPALVEHHREVAAVEAPAFKYSYELRQLSIPLTDKSKMRSAQAQFSLLLDCPDQEAQGAMLIHRARILDLLFETAASMSVEDFETPKGLEKFKGLLMTAMQERLGPLAPRQIAIKQWFMQ